MKNRYICIILAIIAVIAFAFGAVSDISLTSEATEESGFEPALVGMFVTTYYLPGRLDAVLEELSITDIETGAQSRHKEYVFSGVEGFPFYHCEIEDKNGNYGFLHTNGIICDVKNIINVTDTAEENIITGTLFTVLTDKIFYANPVYQDNSGNVWLEPGDGMNVSASGSSSIKLGNEIKATAGNKTTAKKYTAELKIEYANPVKELMISEMDKNDRLIKKENYVPENIASEYKPSEDTEYIIVNALYNDSENNLQEKRDAYGRADSEFSYMTVNEDGIGINKCSEIIW